MEHAVTDILENAQHEKLKNSLPNLCLWASCI